MGKQFVVRNLGDANISRLKTRARKNGRSFEAEVREILKQASKPVRSSRRTVKMEKGFGTRLAEIFAEVPADFRIPRRSKDLPRPAKF